MNYAFAVPPGGFETGYNKNMDGQRKIIYAEDDDESIRTLCWLRIPSLVIGLGLGVVISFAVSKFEEVLSRDIRVAFFLPFIVYMADAVGTQTQTIYARDLKAGKAKFRSYLGKELSLGVILGILFGVVSGAVVSVWIGDARLALSVALAMLAATASAPIIALLTTEAFQLIREDPAAGSGPIATVIQDMVSVVIYGVICSAMLLH